ncbi:MAG: deoxyribodipyrimidine photo-lyase [Sulfurimonas sp.]|nr:deoxyribodipyrimidine photo-lyase [Sulfurimonas sp.]
MRRLLWFRRDLRTEDNPLLSFEGELLPIFIFDTNILEKLQKDDKRVSYIFHSISKLKEELRLLGLDLKILYGDPVAIIKELHTLYSFDEVVASGDYDAYARNRDLEVSHILHCRYLQDTYIFRHDEVLKDDGTPYYVFTPFYKKALKVLENKNLKPIHLASHTLLNEEYKGIFSFDGLRFEALAFRIESLGFVPVSLNFQTLQTKIEALKEKLSSYKEQRDFLDIDATSHLSTELRFGVIGVRQLLRETRSHPQGEAFVRQLIFRDFYAYLLFHLPYIENKNYKYSFNGIEDVEKYQRFCEAKTGVPIVDAGVRELLSSGDMHNRVRMIVASFFTKDLLLPWQWGEAFFAKHLLDYDKASNILSWQWSAGTGVDPQPYFRVFNPYLQSKKFDKECVYIKRYMPELKNIEPKYLHDESSLFSMNIEDYPKPMVYHKEAAKLAVEIFKKRMELVG